MFIKVTVEISKVVGETSIMYINSDHIIAMVKLERESTQITMSTGKAISVKESLEEILDKLGL